MSERERETITREREVSKVTDTPGKFIEMDAPQREMSKAELTNKIFDDVFIYHPPRPGQEEKYAAIRAAGKSLVMTIIATCPQCADRSAAVRKVREAVMTANASIALNGAV
jgi:hypothetical protein